MTTLWPYRMKVNLIEVAIFYVANMSFNTTRENDILAKNSEFTVLQYCMSPVYLLYILRNN